MPNLVISLAYTGRLAKTLAGSRRHRGKLCSVNLWMVLAVIAGFAGRNGAPDFTVVVTTVWS
jgi:hypothetical protein